ncbi:MAG: hypothetical protein WCS69_00800 [Ignavibacteriaceae bacterium]
MKNKMVYSLALMFVLTSGVIAQNRFSVGIIGTRFGNSGNDYKLTEIKNPIGSGLFVSYAPSNELSLAFTGEYFKDDMENNLGKERDVRGHLSAFFTPFSWESLRPYLSAGIIYTNRKYDYSLNNINKTDDVFNERFAVGVDYRLIQNLSVNIDLGIYNDGMNIVGWSNSIGLRYGISGL